MRGWRQTDLAERAGLSVGMISLIESGQRLPSVASWQRLREELGIDADLPVDIWQRPEQAVTEDDLAKIGACLAAAGTAALGDLAEATDLSLPELRLALRRLSNQLEVSGMHVIDDGVRAVLTAHPRWSRVPQRLVEPDHIGRLTEEQAFCLAVVLREGECTRRHIEELREGEFEEPGCLRVRADMAETLALLRERGLLAGVRDDGAPGRPLQYRVTTKLLRLVGAETIEEARAKLAPAHPPMVSESASLALNRAAPADTVGSHPSETGVEPRP
jgi:transcriptional regulator with XRE-family HTH domain